MSDPQNNPVHRTDIAIIGAGPTGLFAVFEAGLLGLKAHVVDALDMVGGQCAALYPEKPIFDIPAHPQIAGQDLIDQLAKQAAPFEPTYHLGQQVTKLEKRADGRFMLETSVGTVIDAGAVIIAAGCGAFGPNKPPMEGLEDYEGSGGVQYYVKRRVDFAGKKVVIAGGGDSAVDWALSLHDIAEKVMVVHRRPKFRAAPDSIAKLEALAAAGKIEMVIPYQLHSLKGENGKLSHVVVATLKGEELALEADHLLPFFGLAMELGPIADWGLDLDRSHIGVTQATMATSVPGIFAIGDIATYDHKLKLILSGFAEGASAVHAARSYLFPDKEFHFEYSTTTGVPAE
ncbi:NAD(P)/FAD-dependent oxidoreductase [Thalassospira sp.]|uniref:NAD(P)/FAD-dependent oxidoreductase n=1 Tax=Thalassospira sp. TaxID=1912094 RepID=UPI002733ED5F|nr:NAD(P)/FAD-dependent oxidoreductase [Thalassospira sp.]MDP2699048.1 NAD(P)/FAD-dependent oxidoreductase [Thalassospira sp.]